jgi:hypothetical protein
MEELTKARFGTKTAKLAFMFGPRHTVTVNCTTPCNATEGQPKLWIKSASNPNKSLQAHPKLKRTFLTTVLHEVEWSASSSGNFIIGERILDAPWKQGWVIRNTGLATVVTKRKILASAENRTPAAQPVATHFTQVDPIPAFFIFDRHTPKRQLITNFIEIC